MCVWLMWEIGNRTERERVEAVKSESDAPEKHMKWQRDTMAMVNERGKVETTRQNSVLLDGAHSIILPCNCGCTMPLLRIALISHKRRLKLKMKEHKSEHEQINHYTSKGLGIDWWICVDGASICAHRHSLTVHWLMQHFYNHTSQEHTKRRGKEQMCMFQRQTMGRWCGGFTFRNGWVVRCVGCVFHSQPAQCTIFVGPFVLTP